MTVTYRVFREENGQYVLREVFYERDGRIINYGHSPIIPKGGSLADLAQEIDWLKEALTLPVLTIAEIEQEIAEQPPKPKRESRHISHEELMAKLDLAPSSVQSEENLAHANH